MAEIVADKVLDIDDTHAWLNAHGYKCERPDVVRMATKRRLPFFKGPNGRKVFVKERELVAALEKMAKSK